MNTVQGHLDVVGLERYFCISLKCLPQYVSANIWTVLARVWFKVLPHNDVQCNVGYVY